MSNPPVADGQKELEQLIIKNIPRDVFMACEDAYHAGDLEGRLQSVGFASGHKSSAAGHNKHFRINERFHVALQARGANPTPLCGTRLVIGRLGIFNLVRLNVPGHKWPDLGRSTTRKKLAELNHSIQKKYIQDDLFAAPSEVAAGTIFILGLMDGIDASGISQLTQVMVGLPAPDMRSWLYINTMADFVKLYDQLNSVAQTDNVVPKLKTQPKKQTDDDQGN